MNFVAENRAARRYFLPALCHSSIRTSAEVPMRGSDHPPHRSRLSRGASSRPQPRAPPRAEGPCPPAARGPHAGKAAGLGPLRSAAHRAPALEDDAARAVSSPRARTAPPPDAATAKLRKQEGCPSGSFWQVINAQTSGHDIQVHWACRQRGTQVERVGGQRPRGLEGQRSSVRREVSGPGCGI